MPSWEEAAQGAKAPYPEDLDAGEWRRGCQYHASSARELHFSERVVLPASSRSGHAMLLSHAVRSWRGTLALRSSYQSGDLVETTADAGCSEATFTMAAASRTATLQRPQLQEGARPAW